MTKFYVGLGSHIGSALAVLEEVNVEQRDENGNPLPTLIEYHCRHLERFPIGVSYPMLVENVKEWTHSEPLQGNAVFIPDADLGRPVLNMFLLADIRCYPVGIHDGYNVNREGTTSRVPRYEVVRAVQVCMQRGRIKFAKELSELSALLSELTEFQITENEPGALAKAVAFPIWFANRRNWRLCG